MGSSCNRPRCRRTDSHHCSTLALRTSTPRPGSLPVTTLLPPTSKNHPASRIPPFSPSWASRRNSTTNPTMNTPSPSTLDPTYSSVDSCNRRPTTSKYRLRTPRARNERTGPNVTLDLTGKCCRLRAKYLRELSPVLWRGIEKCVEIHRRT